MKLLIEYQNSIENLTNEVSNLKNTIDSQKSEITKLQNTINSQKNDMTKLENTINSQKSEIAKLQNTINSQKSEITKSQNTINSQKSEITKLQSTINSQKSEIAKSQNTINSQKSEITKLQSTINSQKSEIAKSQNTVNSQKSEIIKLQSTINSQKNQINMLDQKIISFNIGKFAFLIDKPFYIRSKGGSKFVIDTNGHQNGGGNIQIYQKSNDMHVNQTWTVDKDGHLINWQNKNSILYLDHIGNYQRPRFIGRNDSVQKTNSPNCKWKLNDYGQIESFACQSQVLDVSSNRYVNSTPVIIFHKNGGANQRWDCVVVHK